MAVSRFQPRFCGISETKAFHLACLPIEWSSGKAHYLAQVVDVKRFALNASWQQA